MKTYLPRNGQDPLMATWHITASDLPGRVTVRPIYPGEEHVQRIPGEIAISYLPRWINERLKEHQTVIDMRENN